LILDDVTAGDYLQWIRDPEPPGLGHGLRSVVAHASPLAHRIRLELLWEHEPPPPQIASAAAGFPATPDVLEIHDAQR
jgi:hypothetical protein